MIRRYIVVALLLSCAAGLYAQRADILFADFESGTWAGWTAEGSAFDTIPAQGTLDGQQEVIGYHGQWLVNTYVGGDKSTGTLLSDPFTVERNFINFLIGGGSYGDCRMELLEDGLVIFTAMAEHSEERLKWSYWDVTALQGKELQIRIVDNETGGWGHICVDDIVFSDNDVIGTFEGGTYGAWTTTGDAFGDAPATGAWEGQNTVAGYGGYGFVNSYLGGDVSTGILSSPVFLITKPYINFRIGGGFDPAYLQANLYIDGQLACTSTPVEWVVRPNDAEQERLRPRTWDVSQWIGHTAYIQVVDNATGGWGHINVDDFIQSDERASYLVDNYTVSMQATQPYLMVPIQNGTPYAYLTVRDANNNVLYRQRMRIAEDGMDRCLPVYIGSLSGQQITVTAGHTYTSGPYASAIHLSATPELDPVPDPDRPVYHHTPAYGWMNDPNGLIYHNGRYHLFYQHYPYDTHWNNMHWGHAVSTDLIHWEELPIVFYPDEYGDMFSGSMVVDEHNTAGFGSGAFVAIYTSTAPRQAQNIAYSLDEGMTWRKLGAPVLWGDGDFRDPKVFWHDGRQCWLMALANGFQTQVYSSVNLRDWNWEMGWGGHVGQHPGTWECPDIIDVPIEGTNESRSVMLVSINDFAPAGGSGTQYFIGEFVVNDFILHTDGAPRWIDYGRDHYAGVTWLGKRTEDGRPIYIAWMNNWDYCNATPYPWSVFRGQNTFPRALSLVSTPDGLKLKAAPIPELIDQIRSANVFHPTLNTISDTWSEQNVGAMVSGAYIIEMDLEDTKHTWKLTLSNSLGEFIAVGYNAATNEVYLDRKNSGETGYHHSVAANNHVGLLHPDERATKALLLIDRTSVEFLVNDSRLSFSDLIFPSEPYTTITLSPEGEPLGVTSLKVTEVDMSTEPVTKIDCVSSTDMTTKQLQDGVLYIYNNGRKYTILGNRIY